MVIQIEEEEEDVVVSIEADLEVDSEEVIQKTEEASEEGDSVEDDMGSDHLIRFNKDAYYNY